MQWYNTLIRPELTPPDTIFAPVWTVLYVMMALSFFIMLRKGQLREKTPAFILFFIQLGLNLVWSPVFFGLKNIAGALIIICLMWLAILMTISMFRHFSKSASWLLVPYFLWTTFAVYLNGAFFLLNR